MLVIMAQNSHFVTKSICELHDLCVSVCRLFLARFVLRSLHLTVRCPHPQVSRAINRTASPIISLCKEWLWLWPKLTVQWQVRLTGLAKSEHLSGFDGRNKEFQNTHREASRLSPVHLHTHLRSFHRCWLRQTLCVYCCAIVANVGTHRWPTPPCWDPLAPWCKPQTVSMKLDTTVGGWQRQLKPTPWTTHTSTFCPIFLCSSIMLNYAFTESSYTTI